MNTPLIPSTAAVTNSAKSVRPLSWLVAATALALGGCASAPKPVSSPIPAAPPAQRLDLRDLPRAVETPVALPNRASPDEVVRFAHALATQGEYGEAGKIFEDAARRFHARDGHFPAVAFLEAANAYALAGDLVAVRRALDGFDALEASYVSAAYRADVARLRRLARGEAR